MGDGSEMGSGSGGGVLSSVNLDSVHLDQLPAYEDGSGRPPSASAPSRERREDGRLRDSGVGVSRDNGAFSPPSEPPPGYEETQRESVADELERRLRSSEGKID